MKEKTKIMIITVSVLLFFTFTGCVSSTMVTFSTDVEDAEVYVDGSFIGTTPASVKLSNAIWNDPVITIKKDGYKIMNTQVKKEIKGANVALGLTINLPAWLWCYGPSKFQNFLLIPNAATN